MEEGQEIGLSDLGKGRVASHGSKAGRQMPGKEIDIPPKRERSYDPDEVESLPSVEDVSEVLSSLGQLDGGEAKQVGMVAEKAIKGLLFAAGKLDIDPRTGKWVDVEAEVERSKNMKRPGSLDVEHNPQNKFRDKLGRYLRRANGLVRGELAKYEDKPDLLTISTHGERGDRVRDLEKGDISYTFGTDPVVLEIACILAAFEKGYYVVSFEPNLDKSYVSQELVLGEGLDVQQVERVIPVRQFRVDLKKLPSFDELSKD